VFRWRYAAGAEQAEAMRFLVRHHRAEGEAGNAQCWMDRVPKDAPPPGHGAATRPPDRPRRNLRGPRRGRDPGRRPPRLRRSLHPQTRVHPPALPHRTQMNTRAPGRRPITSVPIRRGNPPQRACSRDNT
jgi:hypothetical protein